MGHGNKIPMDSLPEETGIGAIDVCPFHETGAASRAMQLFYRKDPLMMRRKHFLIAFVSLFLPMLLSFFGLSRLEKPLIERSLSAPKEGFVLKIGMEANYPSFNWTETTNDPEYNYPISGQVGQYAGGYDVQIARFLAEDNGWQLEIYKLDWDSLVPSLQSGTINAVIAGMSDTAERRQSIDFTNPYYTSELVLIARKDDERFSDDFDPTESEGIRFVTQLGTVEDEIAKDWAENYGATYVNPTEDYPMSFMNVSQNLADAVICEYPVAMAMMDAYPSLAMYTVDETKVDSSFLQQLSVSIGIAKDDRDGILAQLNASLAKLDDEDRKNFMDAALERSKVLQNMEGEDESGNHILYLLENYWVEFGYGTLNTLILAVVGTIVGLVIGIFVSQVRNLRIEKEDNVFAKSGKAVAKSLAWAYETFFRATPMMIQAMIFFLLGPAIGIIWTNLSPSGDIGRIFNGYMLCGLIVICINTGAYMTENIKSGLNGVDKGQSEAARSLGLSKTRTLYGVVLPQAIRNVLPTIGNELVVNIKDSSVLNVIGLTELYMTASIATNTNYFRIEGYVIICVIYLVLVLFFSAILKILSNRLSFPDQVNWLGFRKGRLSKAIARHRDAQRKTILIDGLKGEKDE